jgi:MFS transporter, sugar porter (SP) family
MPVCTKNSSVGNAILQITLLSYPIAINHKLFAVTLGAMAVGTVLAWTSPTLLELQSPNSTLPVTPEEGSWIGSLVAVGAIAGALPAGYLADRFGRKLVLLALSAPFLLSWIMITAANAVGILYAARLIAGFATGATTVVAPMFIGEIAESSVRGALGSYFQLMLTVGILYTYVVGAIANYIWLGILSGIVPVVFFLTFLRVPESPTYLMKKHRTENAKKSLQYYRGPSHNIWKELQDLNKDISEATQAKVSMRDLISSKGTRRALVIALGIMIFQQLSGVNAVIFYSGDIFKAAGSTLDPKIASIIVGVVQVVVTYIASAVVDRAGRKVLLLLSASIMSLCLAVLGLYFCLKNNEDDVSGIGWLPLLCVTIYIVMFSLGFGPLPWLIMGEVFAPNVKGAASSVAVCTNWTLTFVVTYSFGKLIDGLGEDWTFWSFAIICGIATVFTYYLVPETKGKTLSEIQRILNGDSAPKKDDIL